LPYRAVDVDADEDIGPYPGPSGGICFGGSSARARAYEWGRVNSLSGNVRWFRAVVGHRFTVVFVPRWPPGRSVGRFFSRFWMGDHPTMFDVELNWAPPLPAEAALLCCFGLRLMLDPRPWSAGGGA
jgi:hypothetical protein